MTIIIDANNLLHKDIQLKALFNKDKEAAQRGLIEKVRTGIKPGEKIIFVFDGHGKLRNSNVIFSGNVTADEIIRKKIENFKDAKKLTIVSSDSDITGLAKVCGCNVKSSESFLIETGKSKSITAGKNINQNFIYDEKEKPDRMNKKEIEEFKKYFT